MTFQKVATTRLHMSGRGVLVTLPDCIGPGEVLYRKEPNSSTMSDELRLAVAATKAAAIAVENERSLLLLLTRRHQEECGRCVFIVLKEKLPKDISICMKDIKELRSSLLCTLAHQQYRPDLRVVAELFKLNNSAFISAVHAEILEMS